MIQLLISAVAVFISTEVDDLLILMLVFSQVRSRKEIAHIVAGRYLSIALLAAVSLAAAFALHFIPEEWITGFLGVVPVALGVRAAVTKEDEDEESEMVKGKLASGENSLLFWTITLLSIASGGDNLGIYIPYFAALPLAGIFVALIVFAAATPLLCWIGYKLSSIPTVSGILEKYDRILIPLVYIGLGIYIMIESGTISKIVQVISG